MTLPAPAEPDAAPTPWRLIAGGVLAVTLMRVAVLFLTPLELYPDEAQYWAWSRHLAFGYFSKPPMIAWLIAATTAIGGDREPWVRLSAPLLHGGAALLLAGAAARLYGGGRVAPWAAAVYTLMPGVQLSSGVIATDAPLLFFLSLALLAYATLWRRPGAAAAAALGVALGLACLSKYAGFYAVLGAAAHAVVDRRARAAWSAPRLMLAAALFLAVLSPNLAWNALHGFQTVAHTAADADWREPGEVARRGAGIADPRGPGGFVLGQFAVFGPAPFLALLAGVAWLLARRRAPAGADRLLLCFATPPLLIVLAEAALARANANWAAAAYPAAAALAAAWLSGSATARRWRDWGLAVQAVAAAAFMVAALQPGLADAAGLGGTFKRARGWARTTREVRAFVSALGASGQVSAVAVDDRFMFNALTYYGRAGLGAPVRMWVHEAKARNQAEAQHPLTPAEGGRVAFASVPWTQAAMRDFARVSDVRRVSVPLDRRHVRAITLFAGAGFRPVPRIAGRAADED